MIVAVAIGVLYAARRTRAYVPLVVYGGSAVAIAIGVLWLIERTANVSILPF